MWGILFHYFIRKKSAAEMYKILTVIMLYQIRHTETGFDMLTIMILNLTIENFLRQTIAGIT